MKKTFTLFAFFLIVAFYKPLIGQNTYLSEKEERLSIIDTLPIGSDTWMEALGDWVVEYAMEGEERRADSLADVLIHYAEQANRPIIKANALTAKGKIEYTRRNFDRALSLYHEALEICRQEDNHLQQVITLRYLAGVYSHKHKEKSLELLKEAEAICKKHQLNRQLAFVYRFMGSTFSNLAGTYPKESESYKNHIQEAESYFTRALNQMKLFGDSLDIAYVISGMNRMYLLKLNRYEEVVKNGVQLIEIRKAAGEFRSLTKTYVESGMAYTRLNQFLLAKAHLDSAYTIIKAKNYVDWKYHIFKRYYELALAEEKYKEALNYFQQMKQINDSVSKRKQEIAIEELSVNYDNKILKQEKQDLQSWNTLISIIIFLAVLAIGILVYFFVKIRKQADLIKKQNYQLTDLNRVKSRFFTNITHEFRTPLTLILGPIEQLMANGIPPAVKAKMQSVKHNARQLLALISQLLDVSKLEAGQMEVKASTANVVAFTAELVKGFETLAKAKEQTLVFTPHARVWETHFDGEKYSKIVYNLLSNAIKYTPDKGAVELMLFKNETAGKEEIEIRVKDTGTGIAQDKLPYIFDRFYQADDSSTRKGEGTGIGLALVKELVELQNGKIDVKSEVGKGSIFTVSFPVLPPPAHPGVSPEVLQAELAIPIDDKEIIPDEIQADGIPGTAQLELLIIEDNAQMRGYIRSCMDASIYNISEAADGEEGIKKAQEIVPDLIISDIMMPKKDGFEVTHAIRNHIGTSHIPLILLTAKTSQESRLEGLERGADAYLTKPFSPQELLLRIRKLIELRKLTQARYQSNQLPETAPGFQKEDSFVTELRTYIGERISEPDLGADSISRHFALSRMQFYRKLKTLTNTSVSHYIQSVRLEKAMQLLKEQQLNITEVAYATGFSSVSYFSKKFKKMYGKNPSQAL